MRINSQNIGKFLVGAILFSTVAMVAKTVIAANIGSQVIVGNAAPTVSSVLVNGGVAITLTANTTTVVQVNGTVTDSNGCSEILGGTSTIMLYRSGIGSSTCTGTQNNLNCYKATAFTATSTCQGGTQINTTTTFSVYYFANATDASSSYPTNTWMATIIARDSNNSTGTADSAGVELNTLTAIDVTAGSINYGTISAGSDTASTNQTATSTNAGNSTTTLQLRAVSTLTSGANSIATSSQRYATSSFTFPGGATQLSESLVSVSGYSLTAPTSTSNVARATFWGLTVPGGTAQGTYNGTTEFAPLFQP